MANSVIAMLKKTGMGGTGPTKATITGDYVLQDQQQPGVHPINTAHIGPYNTRSRAKGSYRQLGTQSDYLKYSFLPTAIRAWNMLPDHVANSSSLGQFKAGLCKIALDQEKIYKC